MPDISIMVKPASSSCNMKCAYCFYKDVAGARNTYSFGIMPNTVTYSLITKALEFADGASVSFAFQGGEPLLAGKEYFANFVKTVNERNTKNSTVYYSVQTNGTLLDDEWCEFFTDNGFLVGLSLDGDEDTDRFRVYQDGTSTFADVTRAADMLCEHKTQFNIVTVVTAYCARNIDKVYDFFRQKGYRYLQFIPCLRPFGKKTESELYMTPVQYGEFLIKLFNNYVKDFVQGNYTSIRLFDNWVQMYLGNRPEQCGVCGHCTRQFVVEANGNVYPCDFYCLDEWRLGNVNLMNFGAMANSETSRRFLTQSLYVPAKCGECRFFPVCRAGGCRRSREDRDYCESYKMFFEACLPLFRVFSPPENK